MKNTVGVVSLMLVTTHLGVVHGILNYLINVKIFGLDYMKSHPEQFYVRNCPGICFPPTIRHMCPLVYENTGCKQAMVCCVSSIRVELNSPNSAEATLLTDSQFIVKIPETTTIKDIETSSEDDVIITTNIPPKKYETTEALELEKIEDVIEKKKDELDKDNISCSGVCIESRLTKYCEAYFSSTDLCKSGKLCCVSISSYGDTLPSDLVVPLKTISSTEQSTTMLSTTPNPKKSFGRECTGECLNGLFTLFCDDIDGDAICPSDGTCCRKATKMTTSSPTTTP